MHAFDRRVSMGLQPLHNGALATAQLKESNIGTAFREHIRISTRDIETWGWSQAVLRIKLVDFWSQHPDTYTQLKVTITHYDLTSDVFTFERCGQSKTVQLCERPIRLAAKDGAFTGSVSITLELHPLVPSAVSIGPPPASQTILRYQASPASRGTSEERYRLLHSGNPSKNHPHYGKQWVNFNEELHRHSQNSRAAGPSSQSTASVSRREVTYIDYDDDKDGRGSCQTPTSLTSRHPARQASASAGLDPRKQSSFSSLDSSLVIARSSKSPRQSSAPLTVAPAHLKPPSERHSLDVAVNDHDAALRSSSERPSAQHLNRAVEARRMELERLKREYEEEERLMDEFEAQEQEYKMLEDRKARLLARKAAAAAKSGSTQNGVDVRQVEASTAPLASPQSAVPQESLERGSQALLDGVPIVATSRESRAEPTHQTDQPQTSQAFLERRYALDDLHCGSSGILRVTRIPGRELDYPTWRALGHHREAQTSSRDEATTPKASVTIPAFSDRGMTGMSRESIYRSCDFGPENSLFNMPVGQPITTATERSSEEASRDVLGSSSYLKNGNRVIEDPQAKRQKTRGPFGNGQDFGFETMRPIKIEEGEVGPATFQRDNSASNPSVVHPSANLRPGTSVPQGSNEQNWEEMWALYSSEIRASQ